MTKKKIIIAKAILFIIISVYLAFIFDKALSNMIIKLPFGWVLSSILLRIFITFAFARGFQLIITSFKNKFNSFLGFLIGVPLGFIVSFITPIYNTDYSDLSSTNTLLNVEEFNLHTNNSITSDGKPKVVAFFTTSCPHCKIASQKIGSMTMANKSPMVYAVFPGTKKDTEVFIKQNKGQYFKSILLKDQNYFIKASEGAFPSVFLIDGNGKTIKHWVGELSYPALDYILKFR
jgi:thiol-disulfide isomerase/thioredoxin